MDTLLDVTDNYKYSFGTNNVPIYNYYSWMFDIEIDGKYDVIYSNNSAWTLYQWGIKHTYYRTNDGFSLNYDPIKPNFGYGQSYVHELISSASGINVNPITGDVTLNGSAGYGPLSIKQSMTIKVTVRPMEATLAAIAGGALLLASIPGPVDDGIVVYVASRIAGAVK